MFRAVTPMLLVDDVNKAVAFYQDVLGARLRYSLPQNPPFEWASLLLGDVEFMFWQREAAQREYSDVLLSSGKPSDFMVYVYVDNVHALYELVKCKVTVLQEPKDQFYGIREFTVRDPFGFILTFAQMVE